MSGLELFLRPWAEVAAVLDLIDVPIFVVDVDESGWFRFDGVNAAHTAKTQISNDAIAGKTPEEVLPVVDAMAVVHRYRTAAKGRQVFRYEEDLELPAGRTRWETTLAPLIDPDTGRVRKLVGSAIEVSAHREAMDRLERLNTELRQFVKAAAHDLRSPLRQMAGLLDLLARAGQADQRGTDLIEMVQERCKHLVGLLDDLHAFAVAGGESTICKVDLEPLVAQAWEFAGAGPGFAYETELDVGAVITMRAPLRQVLNNLVGNAIAHHDRDHGRVRVAIHWHRPGELEVSVADDGPGIPKNRRQWVLGPLNRGTNSQGSGLGLAVVDKVVQEQGGELRLTEGLDGRGLAVRVVWPALSLNGGI